MHPFFAPVLRPRIVVAFGPCQARRNAGDDAGHTQPCQPSDRVVVVRIYSRGDDFDAGDRTVYSDKSDDDEQRGDLLGESGSISVDQRGAEK